MGNAVVWCWGMFFLGLFLQREDNAQTPGNYQYSTNTNTNSIGNLYDWTGDHDSGGDSNSSDGGCGGGCGSD